MNSMLDTAIRFVNDMNIWIKAGRPVRPKELVRSLFLEQCKPCEHYKGGNKGGRCNVCNCSIRREGVMINKLAMATTRCPLDDPRWTEYKEASEFYEGTITQDESKSCC